MTKTFENAMKSIKSEMSNGRSKVPYEYDMTLEDFSGLTRMAIKEDAAYAVHYAFLFGFVMGNRATIARNLKKL